MLSVQRSCADLSVTYLEISIAGFGHYVDQISGGHAVELTGDAIRRDERADTVSMRNILDDDVYWLTLKLRGRSECLICGACLLRRSAFS